MSREVEAPEYEEFAVKIVTRQGYRLAAGGICLAGFSTAWEHTFNALAYWAAPGKRYNPQTEAAMISRTASACGPLRGGPDWLPVERKSR